jgi:hypothetical protein
MKRGRTVRNLWAGRDKGRQGRAIRDVGWRGPCAILGPKSLEMRQLEKT